MVTTVVYSRLGQLPELLALLANYRIDTKSPSLVCEADLRRLPAATVRVDDQDRMFESVGLLGFSDEMRLAPLLQSV